MNLIDRLRVDYPTVLFVADEICRWSPDDNTVFYTANDDIALLHELGHALCRHRGVNQDIEILHIERDAWEKAREIGARYGVKIDNQQIEDALDSYRDWLHERSKCPECGQNGVQGRYKGRYTCVNCSTVWSTNDARKTALRRYLHR